mmetsp:Transcript_51372/g.154346  ORF Transcript_51372/g.154346 Transcript_51372/m.154346 type:complete len:383 (-) Transcript_51372:26-1174(-)
MGDFTANFHRPEAGISTVEGTVSGSRAAHLEKKRQRDQELFEERKAKIRADSERGKRGIDDKFDADSSMSAAERDFRDKTVGLVTAEEFRKAAKEAEERKKGRGEFRGGDADDAGPGERQLTQEELARREKQRRKERKKALKKKKKMMSALSFAGADDADGIIESEDDFASGSSAGAASGKKEVKKNPEVDTSFLPDRDREAALKSQRSSLEREWRDLQERTQSEALEITYSYWDGTGHRRTVQVKKGDTVGRFLELIRRDLSKEFREMNNVSSDALLYVKEDLILPHDVTFYDLIATRARGKSGPLFTFDVRDDVRVGSGAIDVRVERDESHPGKVVERRWYDRNRHIFPASRWEVYDPAKDYGRYTIHGGEINKEKKKGK